VQPGVRGGHRGAAPSATHTPGLRVGKEPAGFQWVVAELSCKGRLKIERLDDKNSSPLLSTSTPLPWT